jgi:hypothetical protein
MEIYANIACSLFADPERLYAGLQRDDVWFDLVPLAILLVAGLKGRHIISIPCQPVSEALCLPTYCICAVLSRVTIFRSIE